MRRFALIVCLGSAILLSGCGGGSHVAAAGTGIAANLTLSPTTLSLTSGDVGVITTSMTDKFNSAVTNPPPVTFSSNNTVIANVSPGGQVCAGTWDAQYIVCTPATVGNAVITATVNVPATKNTSAATLTATMPIYVHPRVDRVVVSPSAVSCISKGAQQQLVAQAFSNKVDVTSLAGPPVWSVGSTLVANVDSSSVATAGAPGQTTISASVAGVNSLPITFTTCPVAKISVHVSGSTATTGTLTTGGKLQLVADVFDSKGICLTCSTTNTGLTVSWLNDQPLSLSVDGTGLITALSPPGAGDITAGCIPSAGCNLGLGPVYGNLATVRNSGTENPTVVVTGKGTTTLVAIDTAANTVGSPVTLPFTPNSLLVNNLGQDGLLGSSTALMAYNVSNNTASQTAAAPGSVLAISPDLATAMMFDPSHNTLQVVSVNASATSSFNSYSLAGAPVTSAVFSRDNSLAYAVGGSTLYPFVHFNTWQSSPAVTLATPANAIALLPPGEFLYVAGGSASGVTAYATYDNSLAANVTTPVIPSLIAAMPDGSQVLAADSTGLDVITPSTTGAGNPPTLSNTLTRLPFGGTVAVRQLYVLPDSAHAVIVTDQNQLIVYTASTGTLANIAIANSANCFSGGPSTDGTRLWLGCSDNAVHRFDLGTMSDAAQTGVSFTPDLVAIAPK